MDFKSVDKYIDDNIDSMLCDLAELIKIPSKRSDACEGMPFGKACFDALAKADEIVKGIGMTTKNYDGFMLECNLNGNETPLGIIAHLDVVPEGNGWTKEPFALTNDGERVYGRGVIDDKGPAVAVIHSIKALKECGFKLSKNVRVLLGSAEETGMEDLEYYRNNAEFPEIMLSPDGEFPVINVEKGLCQFEFSKDYSVGSDERQVTYFKAGSVVNAVPDQAEAEVSDITVSEAAALTANLDIDIEFDIEESENGVRIFAKGASAHGSTPEKGDNALCGLIYILKALNPKGELIKTLEGLYELFPYNEGDGEHFGIKMSDEKSGALTILLSLLEAHDGKLTGGVDTRFPATVSLSKIKEIVESKLIPLGMDIKYTHAEEGHLVDDNTPFIKTILKAYSDVTGEEGKCLSVGGATYLHTVDGGVAFGAEMPGEETNMHGADEQVKIETLKTIAKIYARAIYEICK